MLRRLSTVAFLTMIALSPRMAAAQITPPPAGGAAGDDTQPASTRVGAVIFYDYTFQDLPKITDANGNAVSSNSFNVSRAYLNVTGAISHVVTYRITPDVNATRFSLAGNNLDGSLVFRLKYAYAQFSLDDWTGKWRQTYVRGGIQQTPYIDYMESIYRYRFQGTVFTERDGGLSSSDAGATFHTNIPNSYGDFHIGVYNGENYNKAEVNNQKALMVRGTLRPMPTGSALARGIRVTGFYDKDNVAKGNPRNRGIANVVLEQRHYNVAFEWEKKADQSSNAAAKVKQDGYSFFLTPFFKEKGNGWEMLIRYDSLRPDLNFKDRRQNRAIVGLAYWFPHPGGNGTAALLLDYEQVAFKNFATAQAKQQRVFVHGLINF